MYILCKELLMPEILLEILLFGICNRVFSKSSARVALRYQARYKPGLSKSGAHRPTINFVASFSLGLIFFFLFGNLCCYGLTVDRVIATVGSEVITFGDYKQFVRGLGDANKGDTVDQKLLRKFIEEKIIRQEAKRKGIMASDAEVEKAIEEFKVGNGMSQQDFEQSLNNEGLNAESYKKLVRDQIISSKLIGDEVDAKIFVTDKEIKAYYEENKKDFVSSPEKLEVKAIFMSLRQEASVTEITDMKLRSLKIVSGLRQGDNFDLMVDDYCDEPLRSQGGMLGKFAKGSLIPPLNDKVLSLKVGEISDPVWVSEGVYILKLVGKSPETFKKIEEVIPGIRDYLYKKKKEELYNGWINTLWERSTVTIKQSS
jgi:parvulin-like peptidyl-prolyl isomerase